MFRDLRLEMFNVLNSMRPLSVAISQLSARAFVSFACLMSAPLLEAQSSASVSNSTEVRVLEEIVVTARRREESLQDVPVSLIALSASDIEERKIDSAAALTNFAPSLMLTSAGAQGTNFALRGQGSTFYAGPGVVAYFSEVPLPSRGIMPGIYHDMQLVQVLKGPQGTLFGRNTTGGAILFEPARPGETVAGNVDVTVGKYNRKQLRGVFNFPLISDRLLVRASFDTHRRDGYSKDVVTNRRYDNLDYDSFRLGVLAQLTDNVENYTVLQHVDATTKGVGVILTEVSGAMDGFLGGYLRSQRVRDERKTSLGPIVPETRVKMTGIVNKTTWDITENVALRNIVGYFKTKSINAEDADASPLPLIDLNAPDHGWHESVRNISEELQLRGASLDAALDWTVGGYYEEQKPFGGSRGNTVRNTVFYVLNSGFKKTEQRSYALYGQGTYNIGRQLPLANDLNLTAGVRRTWDESELFMYGVTSFGTCSSSVISPTPYPECYVNGRVKSSKTTWTVGLDYEWSPSVLVYLTSRSGYKQGGTNPNAALGMQQFDPENVKDMELGIKSTFDAGSISGNVNVALFRILYDDVQKVIPLPPASSATINAAKATLDGIEIESILRFSEWFQLSANYAHMEGRFKKFRSPFTGQDFSHLEYPLIPNHKFDLLAKVWVPVDPEVGDVSVSVAFSYQDKMNVQQAGLRDPGRMTGDRKIVNLNFDWNRVFGSNFDLSVFGTNVTNDTYFTGKFMAYGAIGYNYGYLGEPRMYGVRLKYSL